MNSKNTITMITKEEKEVIEAKSRENGYNMSPVEELALLGFYEEHRTAITETGNNIFSMYLDGEFSKLDEILEEICNEGKKETKNWKEIEEYEFDENDDKYKLLAETLRYNNDRRKYFA